MGFTESLKIRGGKISGEKKTWKGGGDVIILSARDGHVRGEWATLDLVS